MFNLFKKTSNKPNEFVSVATGEIIPLALVKDEAFASGSLGDGIAIIPNEDDIVAPCDGEISMIFPTMHAFGIKNNDGIEVLIHIGIDTVNKKGIGFKKYVNEGTKVKAGDKIIRVNLYDLKNEGYDLSTIILFPNCDKKMNFIKDGYATKGKTIIAKYDN